jgi:uncharacterized protein (DUF58 family)
MNTTAPTAPAVEDPEVFLAIDDLDLVGRGLADAVWHGQHQSLLRGPGVEFHSHRSYQAGDDLRRVNWALLARHHRLYTRESRAESRRPVYLLLDTSASMSIHHGPSSKLHYGKRALAGAAHLARRQGDAPALRLSAELVLPPRSSADHVSGICAMLAHASAMGATNMADELRAGRSLCRQRGFILVISDFLDHEEQTLAELSTYRAQGHDVFALQVLDPMEVALPEGGDFDFIEPENNTRLRTAAEPIRVAYTRRVAEWRSSLRHQAESHGIRWHSTTTNESLVSALRTWLV